jgi:transcriptional regulator with XRE-family HTH domain
MATKQAWQPVIDIIEELGGTNIHDEHAGKHVKIYFTVNGVTRFYTSSVSPSDYRYTANVRSDIRHMINDIKMHTFNDVITHEDIEDEAVVKNVKSLPALTTFGDKLRFARERKALSRVKLGELTGLNPELIEHFENIKVDPTLDYLTALKLSTALGLTLSYLTSGQQLEGAPNMSDIGRRVMERRSQLHLTIGQLSNLTGIPPNQIVNLEKGSYPDFHRMDDLAKGLECDIEYLRDGKGTPSALPLTAIRDIKTAGDFGLFVQTRRQELRKSQKEFARAIGMNYQSEISKAELGKNVHPLLKRLESVSKFLELPYATLRAIATNVDPDQHHVSIKGQDERIDDKLHQTIQQVVDPPKVEQAIDTIIEIADKSPAIVSENDVLKAIHEEAEVTRELLAEQHKQLLEAIKTISTSGVADVLHAMIDNLFKK